MGLNRGHATSNYCHSIIYRRKLQTDFIPTFYALFIVNSYVHVPLILILPDFRECTSTPVAAYFKGAVWPVVEFAVERLTNQQKPVMVSKLFYLGLHAFFLVES